MIQDPSSMMSFKKLSLKAIFAIGPVQRASCHLRNTVGINLIFINATAPPCDEITLEKLCFPDKEVTPHITENRMPGPLYQLRRLTRSHLCLNYTISYGVDAGT